MKDTFHGWSTVGSMDLDVVTDLIVTGRKASEARPDVWLFDHLGKKEERLNVLDFGCGMGRNTFGIANHSPEWTVVGYDNEGMISKSREYCTLMYGGRIPKNMWFITDWEQVRLHRFDAIFCCIVLQHIYEDALAKYIADFKQMTNRLVVMGRRFNDDPKRRSTWVILEENGLIPDRFYAGGEIIPYNGEGDPGEHNLAIYTL